MTFVNRRCNGITKDRSRGRKNKLVYVMTPHGFKQRMRGIEIILVVLGRVAHRLTHLNKACKVHHRRGHYRTNRLVDESFVTKAAYPQFGVAYRVGVATA